MYTPNKWTNWTPDSPDNAQNIERLCQQEQSARRLGDLSQADSVALKIGRLISDGHLRSAAQLTTPSAGSYRKPQTSAFKPSTNARWRTEAATEKQISTIVKFQKSPVPPNLTKGEACDLIQSLFESQGVRS
jgi:hypothetical protein